MSTFRKILMVVIFIGFAGNIGGAGTLASFNASTTNATSTFSTGSIALSNTNKTSAKTCFSNGTTDINGGSGTSTDNNHNTACEALFSLNTRQPGQTATAQLDIKNVGSLSANLRLMIANHTPPSAPTTPVTACSNRDASDTAYHGTGDICQQLQLTIQRFTTTGRTVASPSGCIYGLDVAPADGTCDAADASRNLKHFTETAANVSPGIDLGTLAANGDAFLTITVTFPNAGAGITTDNAFQGRVASLAMKWNLEQI